MRWKVRALRQLVSDPPSDPMMWPGVTIEVMDHVYNPLLFRRHRKLLWVRLHLAEVSKSLQTVLKPSTQLAERHVAAGVILVYRLRRADTPLAAASWIETRSTDV